MGESDLMDETKKTDLLEDDLPVGKVLAPKTVFEKRAIAIKEFCTAFIVVDENSFMEADRKIIEGTTLKKAIKEWAKPIIDTQKEAYDTAKAQRDLLVVPIEEGTKLLARKMAGWKNYEEAKREAQARAEQELARKNHEQACLEEAERMEKQNAPQEAIDSILDFAEEPPPVMTPVVQSVKSKTSIKTKLTFKITNERMIPREFCKPDESKIRAEIKLKGENTIIAGVELVKDVATRMYSER